VEKIEGVKRVKDLKKLSGVRCLTLLLHFMLFWLVCWYKLLLSSYG